MYFLIMAITCSYSILLSKWTLIRWNRLKISHALSTANAFDTRNFAWEATKVGAKRYSEARTKSNAFSLVILSRLEYPQSKKIRNISGLMHPEINKSLCQCHVRWKKIRFALPLPLIYYKQKLKQQSPLIVDLSLRDIDTFFNSLIQAKRSCEGYKCIICFSAVGCYLHR